MDNLAIFLVLNFGLILILQFFKIKGFTKFYFLISSHKALVLLPLFFTSLFGGYYVYSHLYGLEFFQSFYYALTQFTGDIKLPVELGLLNDDTTISNLTKESIEKNYNWIYLSGILSFFTSFLTLLLFFFKPFIQKLHISQIIKNKNYTLVIGLGENNRAYIESELPYFNNIIVIEQDISNPHINYFENKGIGFLSGLIENNRDLFSKSFPSRILISTGNDRTNIDIASTIQLVYEEYEKIEASTVYIHLENQNYESMYKQKILSKDKDLKIEFKPYSFFDDVARNLCMVHTVLGNYLYREKSSEDAYNMIIVGDGKLAERVIYHLAMLVHLPNKNVFNITCICKDAKSFVSKIEATFMNINNIDCINLIPLSLDVNTSDFYTHKAWSMHNLTNVILCDDDENINLENAVNLYDKVYLQKVKQINFKTKVLIAMFHNLKLGNSINENTEEFRNFYTFGDIESICTREHIIDEKHEELAQLIHKGYGDEYHIAKNNIFEDYISSDSTMKKDIFDIWQSTLYSDRESSISQALHIDTKLLALGLMKEKEKKIDKHLLLDENTNVFKPFWGDLSVTEKEVLEFSKQFELFYKNCEINEDIIHYVYEKLMKDTSLLAKLMKSEHERWNAYHYLNGWEYSKIKDKSIKRHNCLTDTELFDDVKRRITVIYDLYSVVYLPSYLASTGYKIIPIIEEKPKLHKNISIGISGHILIDISNEKLKFVLKKELKKIMDNMDEVKLYSPLAEGADRLFVDTAFEILPEKIKNLTIPMPFDKDRYMEDFKEKNSKEEFEAYFDIPIFKNLKNLTIDSYSILPSKIDNESYFNVGKCVVNNSDIIFALWDGKEANGIGGTGDIVKYVKRKKPKKKVVLINPDTYEVKYIPSKDDNE